MHPFSTPLKKPFLGLVKGCIGNERVNESLQKNTTKNTNTTNSKTIYDWLSFSYRFLSPEIRCNEVIITIIISYKLFCGGL